MKIAFIGAGKMGQALIKGLLASGVSRGSLIAADSEARIRRAVAQAFRVRVTSDNAEAARGADVILLAVKPQQFAEVIGQLAPRIRRKQLVISIAAGITLRWLEARLPGVPIVRVMPNLPATVGQGFSALARGQQANARHLAKARAIFEAAGRAVELPEKYFDAITAVSGSGPAYVFFLVQCWEEAARSLHLPAPVAAGAIRQTLLGSMVLLESSGAGAEELIRRVASKKGTTEAALKVLARRRVAAHFREALQAAARRSKALSR
jgi:pyrroline-5-carboxylate reductase